MTRRRMVVLVIGGVVLYGMAALGFGVLGAMSFVVGFDIVNETGEDVKITPIGMWEGSGQYGPLPRCDSPMSLLPSRNSSDLPLPAGGRITIHYSYDDINFRHILVRRGSGELLMLDTDKKGNLHECYGPQQTEYRVPPLDQLAKAPDELVPCAAGNAVTYSGMKEY